MNYSSVAELSGMSVLSFIAAEDEGMPLVSTAL